MNDENAVRIERMHYTKNRLSAGLALLSVLFDALYFINIYESDVGSWYYSILMGASILYNLIFLLTGFLSSEGVKNDRIAFAYIMIALGLGQILRIFIYPVRACTATVTIGDKVVTVMGRGQFTFCVLWLLLSAACMFAGAAVSINRCRLLRKTSVTSGHKTLRKETQWPG